MLMATMRRFDALVFSMVALTLAGCSGDAGTPTAALPVGVSPTPLATNTPTAPPSDAIVLEGRLLYSRVDEATHTFTGIYVSRPDGTGETEVPLPFTEGDGAWS